MAGIKKLIFNPLIKGNFEFIKDYDSDVESIKENAKKNESISADTMERLSEIDTLVKTLQGNLIIPADRDVFVENGQAMCDVTFDNYKILNNSKKFFVVLDNPITQGNSIAAEEKVFLRIQTGAQQTKTVTPPTPSGNSASEENPFTHFVGYNSKENLAIMIDANFVFFKIGEYATPEIFDKKYSYEIVSEIIGEQEVRKAYLREITKQTIIVVDEIPEEPEEPSEETEEPTEPTEPIEPPTHEEIIDVTDENVTLILAGREETKITFELPLELENGVFGIENEEEIQFGDKLVYTEGEDVWNILAVRHKDTQDCKLKDVLAKRTLMRCVIDPNDSSSDDAYVIGGTSELEPPMEFIKANAYVIDDLNGNIELTHANFPSEQVIYVEQANNSEYSDNATRIIYNDQDTGFTADRSFDIHTGETCAELIIVYNGIEQTEKLKPNQNIKLFYDWSEQKWYVTYQGSSEKNEEQIKLLNTSIPSYQPPGYVDWSNATFDARTLITEKQNLHSLMYSLCPQIYFTPTTLPTTIGVERITIPFTDLYHSMLDWANGRDSIGTYTTDIATLRNSSFILIYDSAGSIAKPWGAGLSEMELVTISTSGGEDETKQNKTDENLHTLEKTIVGAINELNTKNNISGSGHVIANEGVLGLEKPEEFVKYTTDNWNEDGKKWLEIAPEKLVITRYEDKGDGSLNGNTWFSVYPDSGIVWNKYKYNTPGGATTWWYCPFRAEDGQIYAETYIYGSDNTNRYFQVNPGGLTLKRGNSDAIYNILEAYSGRTAFSFGYANGWTFNHAAFHPGNQQGGATDNANNYYQYWQVNAGNISNYVQRPDVNNGARQLVFGVNEEKNDLFVGRTTSAGVVPSFHINNSNPNSKGLFLNISNAGAEYSTALLVASNSARIEYSSYNETTQATGSIVNIYNHSAWLSDYGKNYFEVHSGGMFNANAITNNGEIHSYFQANTGSFYSSTVDIRNNTSYEFFSASPGSVTVNYYNRNSFLLNPGGLTALNVDSVQGISKPFFEAHSNFLKVYDNYNASNSYAVFQADNRGITGNGTVLGVGGTPFFAAKWGEILCYNKDYNTDKPYRLFEVNPGGLVSYSWDGYTQESYSILEAHSGVFATRARNYDTQESFNTFATYNGRIAASAWYGLEPGSTVFFDVTTSKLRYLARMSDTTGTQVTFKQVFEASEKSIQSRVPITFPEKEIDNADLFAESGAQIYIDGNDVKIKVKRVVDEKEVLYGCTLGTLTELTPIVEP